jgi:serine-type D-Ala-D-Ala carboxypeptidase/endopeptidase (penicillin-binding protein 4)
MKYPFGLVVLSRAIFPVTLFIAGCSPAHVAGQAVMRDLLQQPELRGAQVGISVYDPATARYLYNYQGDKYFVPASNTKLFTLYAGLKYLGDSLVGIRYLEADTAWFIEPAGDPTLLHPAFPKQPVIGLLQKTKKPIYLIDDNWQDKSWGKGWAWDDYNEDYMAERSSLPVYGNTIRWVQEEQKQQRGDSSFEPSPSFYSLPEVDWTVRFTTDTTQKTFSVQRERDDNIFRITAGKEKYKAQDVPFITHGVASALVLLKDTVGKTIFVTDHLPFPGSRPFGQTLASGRAGPESPRGPNSHSGFTALYSQPVDSLFKPMMWNSDNFFAEQTLLMVSNEILGTMNDNKIIDDLLSNDLGALPQKPVWVDGSGLSRNDLFTPQDFVALLDTMSREFGLARMERLLPTGGTGTLGSYYKEDSAYIYAKTGSLSGIVALSGYLFTKKDHLLIFSILINNYTGSGSAVRRQIEKLIHKIREED